MGLDVGFGLLDVAGRAMPGWNQSSSVSNHLCKYVPPQWNRDYYYISISHQCQLPQSKAWSSHALTHLTQTMLPILGAVR